MDKDKLMDKLIKIFGFSTIGGLGLFTGYTTLDSTTVIGDGDFTIGLILLDIGLGITFSPTVGTLDSSEEPDLIIRTEDNNNYAKVEARAQKIYDTFHKGHNIDYKPAVLIVDTPERAQALSELFSMFNSKEEMYTYLTALQMVLEEMVEEKKKDTKIKKLEK